MSCCSPAHSPGRACGAARVLAGVVVGACLLSTLTSAVAPPPRPPVERRDDVFPLSAVGLAPVGETFRVSPGGPRRAKLYYKELAEQLNFPGKKMPANLDQLLDYFGYRALQAIDLEEVHPHILMGPREKLKAELQQRWKVRSDKDFPKDDELTTATCWPEGEEILAARYFSPKTSDVAGLSGKLSWRKVVRLKPRPKSRAAGDGLKALYFLSVLYVDKLEKSPFAGRSINVQVILVRDPDKAAKLKDPLCWMVFDPAREYALAHSTATSWDAADPKLIKDHGVRPYYVPDACCHCHGGQPEMKKGVKAMKKGVKFKDAPLRFPGAVPQFFDTDYMLDRTTPGDDFELSLGRSRWGALFDGGRNPYTARFRSNFKAFWKLNEEMLGPTLKVDKDEKLPSTAGLKNWLHLHGEKKLTSVLHVSPIKRGIPKGFKGKGLPKEEWSEEDPVDFQLLPLLNRYCYRCHSGLRYNVLDKDAVKNRVEDMIERLRETKRPEDWMPQDRRLSYAEKKQLIELLQALAAQE